LPGMKKGFAKWGPERGGVALSEASPSFEQAESQKEKKDAKKKNIDAPRLAMTQRYKLTAG